MTGYTNHPQTGALMSVDRTVRAVYDHAYVARYEQYPERWLSQIRAGLIAMHFPELLWSKKTVCDVGYGTGAFLRELHEERWWLKLHGFDVSPYPAPDFVTVTPDWQEREWDLITFFDSLEHFADLDWLDNLKAERAIVSVPWYHPEQGEAWFANWKHRRPGEHLWHFTPETLGRTMARAGLRSSIVSSCEDVVRVGPDSLPNILTMCFRR